MTTKPTTSDMTVAEIIKGLCLDVDAYLNHEHMEQVKSEALAAIEAIRKADLYSFHEYVMGKDLIQKEDDQAYNYARLHRAIDAHLAERLNNTEEGK